MASIYYALHYTCIYSANKQIGDACGGPHGIEGRCSNDLTCTVSKQKFLSGEDIRGICLSKFSE